MTIGHVKEATVDDLRVRPKAVLKSLQQEGDQDFRRGVAFLVAVLRGDGRPVGVDAVDEQGLEDRRLVGDLCRLDEDLFPLLELPDKSAPYDDFTALVQDY